MKVEEISRIISEHCPVNSDAFQDVWLHLLETEPDDMHQLYRSIRKAKNKKITEYFRNKKEISQFDEHGENILDRYKIPTEFEHNNESDTSIAKDFYKQIAIYFLKEFLLEKQKNWELRKKLGDKKLENSHKWRELRQDQLNKKYEMFVEKKKRWEFRKEVINKKLEISRKWQELRKEQLNKKYELRKRRLDLEACKSEENRQRAKSLENTLHNRLEEIENSLKLQQINILSTVAKAMFHIIDLSKPYKYVYKMFGHTHYIAKVTDDNLYLLCKKETPIPIDNRHNLPSKGWPSCKACNRATAK
ncbi:MAG: hypothetical protein NTW12_15335 [Deltaproteobacteria bacterium]|nr:hypothetical protein [Deltaproteobacteria bacterium]